MFSSWNWVDGQLNKQSWLTDKADTAGESWLILGSDEREGTIGDAGDVTRFQNGHYSRAHQAEIRPVLTDFHSA